MQIHTSLAMISTTNRHLIPSVEEIPFLDIVRSVDRVVASEPMTIIRLIVLKRMRYMSMVKILNFFSRSRINRGTYFEKEFSEGV